MASLIWLLIFALAPSAVHEHIIDLVSEEVLPDLKVLPVAVFEPKGNLWKVNLLFVLKQVEKIAIEQFL